MKRYNGYDPFAWFYTNYWGIDFHRQIVPVLDRVLLKKIPRKGRILDLCCGDGRVTARLARRGYRITGLDGSPNMLTYAKYRMPQGEFLCLDARRFRLEAVYDAAISVFDSLNHVMDAAGLKAVFRNVFACLKPGGLFVFDLNSELGYREFWSQTLTCVEPGAVGVAKGTYDGPKRLAICDITVFRPAGDVWQRSGFRLRQRYHPRTEVTKALKGVGFVVEVLDGAKDLAMQGDIGRGRKFYVARKPSV